MSERVELWDERSMIDRLVAAVLGLQRVRLDETTELDDHPGVYLQWFATRSPTIRFALTDTIALGRFPAYAGVAAVSLRERMSRYRRRVAELDAIDSNEVYVATLTLPSAASAKWAEAALHEWLNPPLQGTGWGSKPPGSHRKEQSPIDAILHGRHWARPASLNAELSARLQILERLLSLDPAGPRWEPLVS